MDTNQIAPLSKLIQQSAQEASASLSRWLERDVQVTVESLEQTSLEMATDSVGPMEASVCACCMRIHGGMQGHLLLSFDDASGFALCDALIPDRAAGHLENNSGWGELEISAVVETANIVGCAFLNALVARIPHEPGASSEPQAQRTCMPSPPVFVRDYAASIMEFVLLDQASEVESVLSARTHFSIEGSPVTWQLLLLPEKPFLPLMPEFAG